MLMVNVCPAGLEPPARARNRRKACVKIRRNLQLWILPMIHIFSYKSVFILGLKTILPEI